MYEKFVYAHSIVFWYSWSHGLLNFNGVQVYIKVDSVPVLLACTVEVLIGRYKLVRLRDLLTVMFMQNVPAEIRAYTIIANSNCSEVLYIESEM